jgi:hypothetical protein
MKIAVRWQDPVELHDGSHLNLIYSCLDLECIPNNPGVYVFARKFGAAIAPLYVGQALSLRSRICQQFNNLRLMKSVENAAIGHRIILIGQLLLRPGQRAEQVLDIVEQALIEHFMAEGFELLNRLGTRIPKHSIQFGGHRLSRSLVPSAMNVPKR